MTKSFLIWDCIKLSLLISVSVTMLSLCFTVGIEMYYAKPVISITFRDGYLLYDRVRVTSHWTTYVVQFIITLGILLWVTIVLNLVQLPYHYEKKSGK